ncbi:MAG: PAS domain-containing protein [Rhodocyclaceae bacterium]
MTTGQAPQDSKQRLFLLGTVCAVVCAFVALVAGTVIFALQSQQLARETAIQADLNKRLRVLQTVLVRLGEAESALRGYLLTDVPRFADTHARAMADFPALLRSLDGIPIDNPVVHEHAEEARSRVVFKLEEMRKILAAHDRQQMDEARRMVRLNGEFAYVEKARAAVIVTLDDIRNYRDEKNQQLSERELRTRNIALLLTAIFALCAVLAIVQIRALWRSQKQYASALARSEQQHRAIVEEQTELVSLAREDGTLVYVNPAYARQFGLRMADMIGRNLIDFIDETDRAGVLAQTRRAFESGVPQMGENRMIAADGREMWADWTNRVQFSAEGEKLLHSVGRDITQRKLLEQQLAESEKFVRKITDNLPMRVSYLDREWRYRFVNKESCRVLGKTPEELLGRTRSEIKGGTDDGTFFPAMVEVEQGQVGRFEHVELVDGEERLYEIHAIPDRSESGEIIGAFSLGVDITDLKRAERALRDLTEILENTPDLIVQTTREGRVLYVNPALSDALALPPGAAHVECVIQKIMTPETVRRFDEEIVPVVTRQGAWAGETSIVLAGGRQITAQHTVVAHHDADGQISRYSHVMRDVTLAVQARAALRVQTATLASVIEAIPAMVAVLDREGRYRLVNRAFERWRKRGRDEIVGHTIAELFGQEEHDRSWPWLQRALLGETVQFEKDYPDSVQHTHVSVTCIPLRLEDGSIEGFIGVAQDITQQRAEERRLIDLSERDTLTGLFNRTGFSASLTRCIDAGEGGNLALLYIDLDYFKPVNDTHGHSVGDEVLRLFAQRLLSLVRPTDAVARLGGDEFAIALTHVRRLADAETIADKVVAAACEPFVVGAVTLHVGASVGVAFGASAEEGWQALMERADAQVYRAKAAGRSRRA